MTPVKPSGPAATILVVEDSPTQAERLRHLLERHGYRVVVSTNGRGALEEAATSRPDLVISDVNMPEIDGYELSQRLKANPELRDVPVILVTNMSDPHDVIRGLRCGADNFVLKPYEERYMLGRVRFVLANREMRHPEDAAMGVGISFNGQRHFITADRLQILNLLLSTYDAAIQRNRELVQSKAALEERSTEISLANQFLDRVVENIPDMIFVKDAADLRFVRVNRALEELLGRKREEILGRTDFDFFPREEAEFFTSNDRRVLATGERATHDEAIHTPSGGVRILCTRKLAICDASKQPRFLLGISSDVTEQKEREREVLRLNAALQQRTSDADAANRAKSTFLATMSHEIRTPLNGMLGMLELLSLTQLDDGQRATLDIVRNSSASLLRIVNDVLDFSKIEAGELEIHPEPASIPLVLQDVAQTYAAAARAKGLVLTSLADPEISPALLVDALRLRQILNNFVSNAIKFTSQGAVEIVAERCGRVMGLEQVCIRVRDSGSGISQQNQGRLFKPFSQGHADAGRHAGGTGLGLSICRRLAEMMGGSVEMASELGKGTTMTLRLAMQVHASGVPRTAGGPPAAEQDDLFALRRPAPEVEQAQREGTLVLLADDHPTNRMLLQRQLNTLGYAAEAAEDGLQALELWQSGRFALVITDCEMPGMDGYELAQRIREQERGSRGYRVPIVACTAHALAGEVEKCLAAGMNDYMVKPIDLRTLRDKLQQWLPLPHQDRVCSPPSSSPPTECQGLDL